MGIEKQAFKRKLDNLKITNNQQQNARILQDIENVEDFEMDEDFANELDNDELSTDEETDHENSVTDTDPLKVFFSSDENSDLEYGFFSEDDHNNDEDDEGDTDEDDDGDGNDEDDEEEDDDDEEEEDNDDSDEEEDNDSDDDDYFYYNHDDDYDDTSEEEEEDEDSFNNTKNEESIDDSVDDEEKKEKDKDSNNSKEKKLTNNDINESKSKSKMKKIKTKLSPKGKNKLENNSNKLQKVQTKGNINSTKSSKLEKRSKKLEENKNNMKSQTDKVKVLNKTQSVKNVVSKNKTQSVKNVVSKNKTQSVKNVVSNNKSQSFKKVVSSNKTQSVKGAVSNNKTQSVKNVVSNNKTSDEEYENDSSDEEDIRNTVGNIPMKWYDEYDHIGYNWEGKKIMKPEKGDQLDNFLKRMEDPDFWRTIKDPQTGQDVILSEEDIQLITRIQKQRIPDVQFDEYAPWVEWFTSEVMKTPLRNYPEHKRSFLPSKLEAKKVSKFVHALKMGWMKSTAEMEKEKQQKNKTPEFYMLWQSDDQAEEMRRIHKHIPPPKRHLPGHAESYNPPPEYLFDSKELKEWNKLKATPWKRKLHFIPQKYTSLREVPAYPRYIKERFKRCLDLYLCPRALKMRLTIEPEALVPQLPSPKDLQPFPTTMSMIFKGHTDMVRSITVEPYGQYIASGGDDMTLKIWEIATGRCTKTVACGGVIRSVAWCPNQALSLIAVAADKKVLLINPGVGDHLITKKTDQLLEIIPQSDIIVSERVKSAVQWEQPEGESWNKGIRLILNHFKTVKQVTWHGKGDYFAVVMPDGQNRSVLINQLSKRRSQLPFTKSKGLIQCVLFHPIRPFLFVATQRNVRIYDLVKQEMVKKLLSNSQWISTMAIHPGGDNILVGTYDRKMLWFDLDLSTKPYQTLRLHGTGVRGVAFHKRYPLFASGADDRSLIISHGMVYNDLLQNPLIVPLKRLCNHESYNDFGIFDVMFHPTQPWVFSAGADSTIRMYT